MNKLIEAILDRESEEALELIQTGKYDLGEVYFNGNTALILACCRGLSDVALALIQTGRSKPEHVNNQGDTALLIVSDSDNPDLSDVELALIQIDQSILEE
jgi:ankyrin repeat protein